jgi:hypothetical protein
VSFEQPEDFCLRAANVIHGWKSHAAIIVACQAKA